MKLDWDETKRQATLRERALDFADVALIDWKTAIGRTTAKGARCALAACEARWWSLRSRSGETRCA